MRSTCQFQVQAVTCDLRALLTPWLLLDTDATAAGDNDDGDERDGDDERRDADNDGDDGDNDGDDADKQDGDDEGGDANNDGDSGDDDVDNNDADDNDGDDADKHDVDAANDAVDKETLGKGRPPRWTDPQTTAGKGANSLANLDQKEIEKKKENTSTAFESLACVGMGLYG